MVEKFIYIGFLYTLMARTFRTDNMFLDKQFLYRKPGTMPTYSVKDKGYLTPS